MILDAWADAQQWLDQDGNFTDEYFEDLLRKK